MGKDKVKVGVRVRPFNAREKAIISSGGSSATIIQVKCESNQIALAHPATSLNNNNPNNIKSFTFDHVFDMDGNQEEVFVNLGKDLLSSAFEGYNACLFAYGQTGSGKSYTMLGSSEQRGVIPRLVTDLFNQIDEESENGDTSLENPNIFKVEVSFFEIYNEKVRDLLVANKTSLKVREHSMLGPYVDGLSILAVKSAMDVATLMAEGNKSRTIANTNMNSESSRSHAVFTIVLTQTMTDIGTGVTGEKVSKISLVDLAGSERATKTGAVGERLKEGSNINKSLTTLGLVISKLAESAAVNSKDPRTFIPYRDSVLTWLLKDNLGGNSRTIMLATVSPSPDNYEETLSTLRYADRAKRIVNNAIVNEDPNAKLIRELQAEVKQLRQLLKSHVTDTVLNEKLDQSERLMRQMSEPWEERLQRSEQASQERQAALEKMGISVQQSGISVETNRFYLVNLNADPAFNELLVYYLKERTVVGRPDAAGPPDIQLTGLGIESLHCELIMEPDQTLHLIPYPSALTCVNGEKVEKRRLLHHGDRILWGNHHFFRLNSPAKPTITTSNIISVVDSTDDSSSYEQASSEFYIKQLGDPIHEAVAKLESKHQKDKEVALEKQRQELYEAAKHFGRVCAERQFNALMHVLSPTSSIAPSLPWDAQSYIQQQQQLQQQTATNTVQIATARNSRMAEGLKLLKEFLLKANHMVREANEIASAMKIDVKYSVTLLIPPNNLTPNRPKGALITESGIKVEKDGHYHQIWSMEKLHNRLVDMREQYDEFCSQQGLENSFSGIDPPASFFEPDQPHVLLGIANVFLQALFYDDVTLKYPVPVISQQGEIVGRLHIEIAKISGKIEETNSRNSSMNTSKADTSLYEDYEDEEELEPETEPKTVTVRVTVRHLAGVSSSHYVFCQYVFCDNIVVCPPVSSTTVVRFDHTRYFTIPVSEEFIDYCSESALSFEVWGHRGNQITSHSLENSSSTNNETNNNSVTDRWKEVTSQMKLWVEIQELNENGEYVPVEVDYAQSSGTGGIHQLKQGLQRRINISVETNATVGQLPIVCEEIDQVSLGAITPRSTTLQRPLDSYQEEDLTLLRERWGEALKRRREYLDSHLQDLARKHEKSAEDVEREKSLVSQWLLLTEERNAVLVPTPDSGVPGAPTNSDFKPEVGIEQHMPIVFLDIPEDILSADSSPHSPPIATGLTASLNSLLPKEHEAPFVALPMIRKSYGDFYSAWSDQRMSTESWALVSWDSSVHDCSQLNKPTNQGEVIYAILRVSLRLSHPVQMDCILRKRICLAVRRNRASLAERLKARFSVKGPVDLEQERTKRRTGVTYQIVSHLPKSSEQLETRESLATLAVSHGEAYIEEYLRSISAVDSILNLDRMRQSVHLREEQMKSRPRNSMNKSFQQHNGVASGLMRKTSSVPNISQLFIGPSPSSNNLMGGLSKHPQTNGGMGSIHSHPQNPAGMNSLIGESNSIRRTRPIRSESLSCLSGQTYTSPPTSSATSPSQQSPQTPRPSSLSLGNNSAAPQASKWTRMTTVMEEESSGYGSQKSSEESPTTSG